jgi:hypothetical protein
LLRAENSRERDAEQRLDERTNMDGVPSQVPAPPILALTP